MKTFVITLVLLVGAAAAVFHFYPEWLQPLLEGTPVKELVATSKPVYQWRDEQGRWQVTDKPPPDPIPYEVKQYALDTNLLPSRTGDGD